VINTAALLRLLEDPRHQDPGADHVSDSERGLTDQQIFHPRMDPASVRRKTMSSHEPTPYAVTCRTHGRVFLTFEEYMAQMSAPHSLWACPDCGDTAYWDDDNYERHMEELERAADEPQPPETE
jgi:hypothetical protein